MQRRNLYTNLPDAALLPWHFPMLCRTGFCSKSNLRTNMPVYTKYLPVDTAALQIYQKQVLKNTFLSGKSILLCFILFLQFLLIFQALFALRICVFSLSAAFYTTVYSHIFRRKLQIWWSELKKRMYGKKCLTMNIKTCIIFNVFAKADKWWWVFAGFRACFSNSIAGGVDRCLEHTSLKKDKEARYTVSEREWALPTAERFWLEEDLRVEKNCQRKRPLSGLFF